MLTIGVVARRVGVPTSTIRYYEKLGLLRLTPRLPNGYRVYDEREVALLDFVRRAQNLGLTLKEVSELLDLSRRGQEPCVRVRELARGHLQDIDLKIRQLKLLRRELQELLRQRPRRSRGDEFCPLIEGIQTERRTGRGKQTVGLHSG
jgi:DNA-binding transcriptional MerR regulator